MIGKSVMGLVLSKSKIKNLRNVGLQGTLKIISATGSDAQRMLWRMDKSLNVLQYFTVMF